MASTEKVIRRAAQRFLLREGLEGAEVHVVNRLTDDLWWVAYVRGGKAHTAIVTGQDKDWKLLKTLAGWPPPP